MPEENASDGAHYLRKLRDLEGKPGSIASGLGAEPPPSLTLVPAAEPHSNERRRFARYKCSGSAELKKPGTTVRTWGTFTDISLGGCYVELQATFPPDTEMELLLDLNQIRVRTTAVVRVTYPFLGMGLAFTEMSAEDRVRLEELTATLAAAAPAASPAIALPKRDDADAKLKMPFVVDAMSALKALVSHFETHNQLERGEFVTLVEQSQHYTQF